MKDLVKKYNLEKMVEVVTDRAYDYADIKEEYEEAYKGEMKADPNKCYEYGYGETLDNTVSLLKELKHYMEGS